MDSRKQNASRLSWQTPGGRLLVLDGLSPSGKLRKLAPLDKPAAFRKFDVSPDGKKVLFSMNVGAEGSADKNLPSL